MSFWYHKTDSYQWINGSIREDLQPDERSIWADFLALAALSREGRRGYIERSEGIPYPKATLLTLLNVPEELFDRAVKKCVAEGRLQAYPDGTYYLSNWQKYNDTTDYKARKEAKAAAIEKGKTTKRENDSIRYGTIRSINEVNRSLAKVNKALRYVKMDDGRWLDTETGEEIELKESASLEESKE